MGLVTAQLTPCSGDEQKPGGRKRGKGPVDVMEKQEIPEREGAAVRVSAGAMGVKGCVGGWDKGCQQHLVGKPAGEPRGGS